MQEQSTMPTSEEIAEFSITAYKGIDVGLGKEDPGVTMAKKLEDQYPDHLVLVQAGKFLHAYGRSAHFLNTLKQYRLKRCIRARTVQPHTAPAPASRH